MSCRKRVEIGGGMRCQCCKGKFCVDCRLPQDYGCAQRDECASRIGSSSGSSSEGAGGIKGRSSFSNWERAKKTLSLRMKRFHKVAEARPTEGDARMGNE